MATVAAAAAAAGSEQWRGIKLSAKSCWNENLKQTISWCRNGFWMGEVGLCVSLSITVHHSHQLGQYHKSFKLLSLIKSYDDIQDALGISWALSFQWSYDVQHLGILSNVSNRYISNLRKSGSCEKRRLWENLTVFPEADWPGEL